MEREEREGREEGWRDVSYCAVASKESLAGPWEVGAGRIGGG